MLYIRRFAEVGALSYTIAALSSVDKQVLEFESFDLICCGSDIALCHTHESLCISDKKNGL